MYDSSARSSTNMASQSVLIILSFMVGLTLGEFQDLTWVMDMTHISAHPAYWSDGLRFNYSVFHKGPYGDIIKFVAINHYSTVEHMGTHVDAPYHFYEKGLTMDQVPLKDLIGPLVRVDITEKAGLQQDAGLDVQDLEDWEQKHGQIPDRAFVLMYSGWDKYYGNDELYMGVNSTSTHTHHPGFSSEAAEWLIKERNILGIGVDTISCDIGKYSYSPAHVWVLEANKICIENLKNLGLVPAQGARLNVLPIMMRNGTGTQARVFAEWGDNAECWSGKAGFNSGFSYTLLFTVIMVMLIAI